MGPGTFFSGLKNIADILCRTDFDFESFFLFFFGSQISRFQVPDFQISRNLAWAQLGPCLGPAWARAWARLEPGLGPGLGPDPVPLVSEDGGTSIRVSLHETNETYPHVP